VGVFGANVLYPKLALFSIIVCFAVKRDSLLTLSIIKNSIKALIITPISIMKLSTALAAHKQGILKGEVSLYR